MWRRVKNPIEAGKKQKMQQTLQVYSFSPDNLHCCFHFFLSFFFLFFSFSPSRIIFVHRAIIFQTECLLEFQCYKLRWRGEGNIYFKNIQWNIGTFLLDSPNAGALEIATGCCFMTGGSAEGSWYPWSFSLMSFIAMENSTWSILPSLFISARALQNNSMVSEWLWP